MADSAPAPAVPAADALDEIRRAYRSAADAEPGPDRDRYLRALKAFLAAAEAHPADLAGAASELAPQLDEAALAFSRASQPELARRAVDLGLSLAPGSTTLLHHKALVLLAQNQDLEEVVSLVDRALEGSPHDKGLWATRGDALRLLGRNDDAAEAYLRAQQLDAVSSQFVDKALKLTPANPRALRLKLDLARARGGDASALEACEELLKSAPDDLDLWLAKAELLAATGHVEEALEPLARVRRERPDDPRARLLEVRLLLQLNRTDAAIPLAEAFVVATPPPEPAALEEVAKSLAATRPELALAARARLKDLDPRNLQNLLELRTLAFHLDRIDDAIAACRAVLAIQPENLEAMRGLAEIALAKEEPGTALEAYRAILVVHPHALADFRKALEIAREAGRFDAVRDFAEAILAEDPADVGAQLELARSRTAAGDLAGAVRAYDALLAAHPGELPYLLEKKDVVVRTNDPAQLAPVLDDLFHLDPTRTDVAVERGNLYLALAYERPEGSAEREQAARTALVAYERASTDAEAGSASLLGIARASRIVDDRSRALQAYAAFLVREENVTRHDILKELGHTLREAGRYSEAAEAYNRAISAGLEDPDLFWGAVEVLAHLNQEPRALQLLEMLLARDPTNAMFLRKKGQLLLAAGRRTEALEALQGAVQGAQGDPHAYFEVAEALRSQGAFVDAVEYYRQGLALDAKNRHGRLALAETLLAAGQYAEVVAIVDPLLKEDPNDLAAWKARADAWRALGRPAEVAYSLRAMLLLDPNSPSALLETYRLHRDAGETKEAYDTLSRLLATDSPEGHDATLHLERGDLAAKLGLAEEANQAYEKAAEIDPVYRVEIASRRARLRLQAGRPDLALEVLDDGIKAAPAGAAPNVGALLLRAEILIALERPAEARAVYEEVRGREPKSPVALAGIARSMLDEGQHAAAAEFLRGALPQLPPQESLYLLLAEAESGGGHLDVATEAVRQGVGVLPKSLGLWVRWGELAIARQAWPEASTAFAHALALAPADTEVLRRAGFVAERLDHPNEALALYERATQADPSDKAAWTSRGLALLAIGRPADAQASFERALSVDSDYAPAKDGKKLATQKTRDAEIQRYGREALLLEAKLNRTVTKNDLFVTLHVPYEFLDPVLAAIGKGVKIDLDRLEPNEVRDLETASFHLVSAALDRRPPGIERRGFTLADVAVLSPPTATLDQIGRLFGYLKAVLEADLRPENLRLTPDVEELARKALLLPPEQRTLFQLVRSLKVGVYKARLIKVVEEAGAAVHAPLPSLDLGAYSPEFRAGAAPVGPAAADGDVYFAPETGAAPAGPAGPEPAAEAAPPSGAFPAMTPAPAGPRCVGCGGISSVHHSCGAPLCQHCIGQFPNCPKCGEPVTSSSVRPVDGVAVAPPARAARGGLLKGVFQRNKPARAAPPPAAGAHAAKPAHAAEPTGRPTAPARRSAAAAPAAKEAKEAKAPGKPVPEPPAPPAASAPAPPAPPRRREKPVDDEPRL
ncbi:MAG TPA: tetratricopeptide repeat protein [Thermoplasmata archaeon]|nr:tetratricopeptide repeat protein [Thermoplasmata archaeon]